MTKGLPDVPFSTTPDKVADVVVAAVASGAEQAWAPPQLRAVMAALRHVPRTVFRRLPL